MQPQHAPPNSPLLPLAAAAELLQVSTTTVRAWIKKGYLPNIRIGSKLYVLQNRLESMGDKKNAS